MDPEQLNQGAAAQAIGLFEEDDRTGTMVLGVLDQWNCTFASVNSADQIHDDAWALSSWLGFVGLRNANTARSYRSEVMRFRMFLQTIHRSTPEREERFLLRDATEIDVLLYEAHLCGKLRTGQSVAPLVVPAEILSQYGRALADQPFVTWETQSSQLPQSPDFRLARPLALKSSSVNQALSILHALFAQWMQPDPQTKSSYVGANPVKRIKRASNRMQRQSGRNFPSQAIQAMLASVDVQMERATLATGSESQINFQVRRLARRRWIASMLFGLWGRRSEVAQIRMSDFSHDGIRWAVTITRKGGKVQSLPVASWVMKELMQYRHSMGLNSLPGNAEQGRCIQRLSSRQDLAKDDAVHSDLIYREIQLLCKDTAQMLRDKDIMREIDDVERALLASKLDAISPHWFRHSGASIAINAGMMSLENASKMLGHSSPVITAEMYYHPSENQITQGMEDLGGMVGY